MAKLSDYFDYRVDAEGNTYMAVSIRGVTLLRLPATNKGTAFTLQERIDLGIEGLLPPLITDIEEQVDRLYLAYQRQPSDLAKYQFLRAMQERSEVLFYAMLDRHLTEMVPIIYTPTIGLAVQQFSGLYRTARGLTLSADNIDHADRILDDYPWHDIRLMVVTDASAILGIGDQGMGGLAICIGKLALYTAGGGLCPFQTLPVNLDVGTNREALLEDPHYLGIRQKRLQGEPYFELVDKFVAAVKRKWPKAIIQWEDFAKNVAFDVLARYRDQIASFNDDIQGTGAVALAGLLSACRINGESLTEQTIVVAGAGAGGIGVASAIKDGLIRAGLSEAQAGQRIFVIDGRGLVVDSYTTDAYKLPLAHTPESYRDWGIAPGHVPTLQEVITHVKPSVLLGLSGVAGLFTEAMVQSMAEHHARPIVFPLSNPTANCEATPEEILAWSQGRAIVATGSPFADVVYAGKTHPIGQGNNAFIFPGLGFAAVLGECSRISDGMVAEAAYALADYVAEHYLDKGLIYPPVADLKKVSLAVATRVLGKALEEGCATRADLHQTDLEAYVSANLWQAKHLPCKYDADI
ncbi:NAD-dependent malic enzyme [Methylomonas rapida]|uniref:NAD-dependent malic enzyme n=1 Tax=Methylomonas rapida TaxID=2963939 RepID=A0ABY7GN00_9GAMM|nr:NAD-dependent malic enzyme [Methylomonas rapida]WAR45897.1 NAD-dependent malic enzyme [Methylomonas rapida]